MTAAVITTANTTRANLPVRVWVCPPNNLSAQGQSSPVPGTAIAYSFPFYAAAAWTLYTGLIPSDHTKTPSSLGDASFHLLRLTRQDVGDRQVKLYAGLTVGSYIVVDAAASGPMTFASHLWCGWITRVEGEDVMGTAEVVGTVRAKELGDLLDRQQVLGWGRMVPNDPSGIVDVMQSPPTANLGDPSGQVIGNCYFSGHGLSYTGLPGFWQFARLPSDFGYAFPANDGTGAYMGDLGKYWTRWKLLIHVVNYCRPPSMPPMTIVCQDGSEAAGVAPSNAALIAGYLNQEKYPEVFDLRDLTWRGMLDMLIPRERGLGWKLFPTDGQGGPVWTIFIYSCAADATYGVPSNTNQVDVAAATEPLISVSVTQDASDLPDKVSIEGSSCMFTGTVAVSDGNLAIGWNQAGSTQQDAYIAGATGVSGYATWQPDIQRIQNSLVRSQGWLRDVFTRFVVSPDANGDLRLCSNPGKGAATAFPFCPNLIWDTVGKALSLGDFTISRAPYLGSAVVQRTTTIPLGVKGDNTDARTQWQKIQPQYMTMKVFTYQPGEKTGRVWRDLTLSYPQFGNVRAEVQPDDRGAAIRIEFSPRELLGKGIWPTVLSSTVGAADIDPNLDNAAIPASSLVATIALESDQRVRVDYYRAGIAIKNPDGTISEANVRRVLKVRIPRLRCDGVWTGTIMGLTGGLGIDTPQSWTAKTPSQQADGVFWFRNDWAVADYYAQQAAAFAFRPRIAVQIVRAVATDRPAYAEVGAFIKTITESDPITGNPLVVNVGTVVETVTRSYSPPRIVIQTSLPPPPSFGGGSVMPSPTSGGSTSSAMGGTPTQATQTMREDVQDLQQKTQRLPLITGVPLSIPNPSFVQIIGGQTIAGVPMIQYVADPLTADIAYDATINTVYIAGLGYGMLYDSNGRQVGKVNVRHNYAGFTDPVMGGVTYMVAAPAQMAVTGGGSITVYPLIRG